MRIKKFSFKRVHETLIHVDRLHLGSLGSNEVCTKEGHVAILGEGTEFTLKASLQQGL